MKNGEKLYRLVDSRPPLHPEARALVNALLTLGAQLDATQPFQEFRELRDGVPIRKAMWLFQELTRSGEEVKKLVKWWRDEAWQRANPEHPLSYLCAAAQNDAQLIRALREAVPIHVVRRGKRQALIPDNATPERKQALVDQLTA